MGAFEVDVSNWSPFAPKGAKAILTGATVVFFAYVGFDAVANSAEEAKRPQACVVALMPLGVCYCSLCSIYNVSEFCLHNPVLDCFFVFLNFI